MAIKLSSKAAAPKKAAPRKAPPKAKITQKAAAEKFPGAHADTARFMATFQKDNNVRVQTAAQVKTPYFLRRPTGILSLDVALGGGFQAGGCIEIYGPESAGKTFLLYCTCGQVQRNYGDDTRILIFKTEMREDKDFARLGGLCVRYSEDEISEMDEIRVAKLRMPTFSAEELDDLRMQVGDIVYVSGKTSEKGFDAIVRALDAEGDDRPGGLFQVVGIDSMGALLTETVEEGDVGDSHYAGGGSSRVVTQFMNKIYPRLNLDKVDGSQVETTLIGVNQMRSAMGKATASKYAGDTEKPAMGAWAWKHGQLVSLKLDKSGMFQNEAGGDSTGHTVKWRTRKGKAGTHDGLRGEYDYWHFERTRPVFWRDVQSQWLGGIAIQEDLVETAKKFEVIQSSGAWFTFEFDGKVYKEQGKDALALIVAGNPEIEAFLREETLRAAKIMARYR